MTKQDKYQSIELNFMQTHSPNTTIVTLKNGVKHYGFFDQGGFEDDEQLRIDRQFWFVPNNNSVAFREDYQKNSKKNTRFCVKVDVDELESVVYQTPSREVLKQVAFN